MRFRPALVASALFIVALSQSAHAQLAKGDFVKFAKEQLASAAAHEDVGQEFCRLGIKVNLDLTVIWTSQRLRDVRAGDRIVEVNSSSVRTQEELRRVMTGIAPDSTVNITVERDGNRNQVAGTCKSGREYAIQWNDVLRKVARKDFKGCVSSTRALALADGPTADLHWLYFNCAIYSGQLQPWQRPPEVFEL